MKKLFVTFMALSIGLLAGCNVETSTSTDSKQASQTEAMVKAGNQMVGMPNIVNFTEKRFAKILYELRDQEVTTYSYFLDMQGGLHFICESVGYGIPASVQYVNPMRNLRDGGYNGQSNTVLPQPEPNGLFMPEGLAATYVMCADGKGGTRPLYLEPEIIVSPFELKATGSIQK